LFVNSPEIGNFLIDFTRLYWGISPPTDANPNPNTYPNLTNHNHNLTNPNPTNPNLIWFDRLYVILVMACLCMLFL